MNAPAQLHGLGQSIWLDNITRDLLDSGTLSRYIAEFSVTGLTSNPTIYDKAIGGTAAYDAAIGQGAARGMAPDAIFFDLALADLRRAADLFAPIHVRTGGVDGFVSLEVSPLLAYDADATHAEALRLHALGARPNLFIKIPGTEAGLAAIEETIFAGVPVNVTLLFSPAQYLGCMEAYTRGIERRVEAGLPASVGSVASFFISRWDAAVASAVPAELKNQLGLAIGRQAYVEYRRFFATDRWQRLAQRGCPPPAPPVREHGDQGSCRFGHALRLRPRRAEHRRHDARGHPARPGGSRDDRWHTRAGRRRRCRRSRAIRRCRCRRPRSRQRAPGQGRAGLRGVLELTPGSHRGEGR